MKCLYKYPQAEFPYEHLVEENRRRTRDDPEYELLDTGVFAENRYFDVFVEYAKAAPDDILIRMEVVNRGPEAATLHVLPTVWFRNTWSWGYTEDAAGTAARDRGSASSWTSRITAGAGSIAQGNPELLFTENESNCRRWLWNIRLAGYVKDGIGELRGPRRTGRPSIRRDAAPRRRRTTRSTLEPGKSVALDCA